MSRPCARRASSSSSSPPAAGQKPAESPLAGVLEHLQEHGFSASEVPPRGDPRPEAEVVVHLEGATATIYAFETESAARLAATRFAFEEQAAPTRVRVQREGLRVYVGRAGAGKTLPVVAFEDVVFTAEAEGH